MTTSPNLVSRFEAENSFFWQRDSISSPFFGENRLILTTRANLVTILG
ncbi:hypothetical protein NST54_14095 [Caldifermentibacillus hisashii]